MIVAIRVVAPPDTARAGAYGCDNDDAANCTSTTMTDSTAAQTSPEAAGSLPYFVTRTRHNTDKPIAASSVAPTMADGPLGKGATHGTATAKYAARTEIRACRESPSNVMAGDLTCIQGAAPPRLTADTPTSGYTAETPDEDGTARPKGAGARSAAPGCAGTPAAAAQRLRIHRHTLRSMSAQKRSRK